MFTDCYNSYGSRGFQMKFTNGWTVSVQFGFGNYCDNRDDPKTSSPNAEIAAWDKDDYWYNFGDDKVQGWVKAEEVAEFIHRISKL